MPEPTLYESAMKKLSQTLFFSFAMVFMSIFFGGIIAAWSPSSVGVLPLMYFGTTFLCAGLLMIFPNKVSVSSVSPAAGIFFGLVAGLMGGAVLLYGLSLSLAQPYPIYFYLVSIVYSLVPKGLFREKRADNVFAMGDGIYVKVAGEDDIRYLFADVKSVSVMGNYDGLTITSRTGTISYTTPMGFDELKTMFDGISTFTRRETLMMSAKGKPLEEMVPTDPNTGAILSPKQPREFQGGRHSTHSTLWYIEKYDQWVPAGEPYVLAATYTNPAYTGSGGALTTLPKAAAVTAFFIILLIAGLFIFPLQTDPQTPATPTFITPGNTQPPVYQITTTTQKDQTTWQTTTVLEDDNMQIRDSQGRILLLSPGYALSSNAEGTGWSYFTIKNTTDPKTGLEVFLVYEGESLNDKSGTDLGKDQLVLTTITYDNSTWRHSVTIEKGRSTFDKSPKGTYRWQYVPLNGTNTGRCSDHCAMKEMCPMPLGNDKSCKIFVSTTGTSGFYCDTDNPVDARDGRLYCCCQKQ